LRQSGHFNSGLWLPHTPKGDEGVRPVPDAPSLEQVCFETGTTLCAALAIVLIVQLLLIQG